MYTFYVYALHVSAAQGHLQAAHLFKKSTALCTLSIVLLKYLVVIIKFGEAMCSSETSPSGLQSVY
jgi:hypothetical protein